MTNLVKTAAIADSTPVVVPVGMMDAPMTATLNSAAAGRKIELSSDGGTAGGWYAATPDATTASMINASIRSPITHVRFTGQAGDVFRVQ